MSLMPQLARATSDASSPREQGTPNSTERRYRGGGSETSYEAQAQALAPAAQGGYAQGARALEPPVQLKRGTALGAQDSPALIKAFKEKLHEKKPFHSTTTKLGLFDISYNPKTSRMEARVKCGFKFIDGAKADFPGAKDGDLKWTAAARQAWKNDFITLMEGRWGGKFKFNLDRPGYEGIGAYVDVEVEEVKADWHFELMVTKIPKGEFKGSAVMTHDGTALNTNSARLDSEDLAWSDKGGTEKQKGAVHEFGHMIGLDDEYADGKAGIRHASLVKDALGTEIAEGKTDDIMSLGNHIKKQHYVTFLEGLKAATGKDEWRFV